MANVFVEESSLQDIADAIRSKLGTQDTYKPAEMAGAIETISGGGSTPVINSLSVTANGTYTAPTGVDGYSPVTVNVPTGGDTPTGTKQISITQNGTTTEDVTDYANAEITVNVSGGGVALKTGSFTPSENILTKDIDIEDATLSHFLIYALTSPYGNNVRTSALLYVDFSDPRTYIINSNSSGSSAAGTGVSYTTVNECISKTNNVVTISSTGTAASSFNYFIANTTYRWFAW